MAIGRRMKGREGFIRPVLRSAAVPAGELDLRTRLELVDTVHDDDFAGGQALRDRRVVRLRVSGTSTFRISTVPSAFTT